MDINCYELAGVPGPSLWFKLTNVWTPEGRAIIREKKAAATPWWEEDWDAIRQCKEEQAEAIRQYYEVENERVYAQIAETVAATRTLLIESPKRAILNGIESAKDAIRRRNERTKHTDINDMDTPSNREPLGTVINNAYSNIMNSKTGRWVKRKVRERNERLKDFDDGDTPNTREPLSVIFKRAYFDFMTWLSYRYNIVYQYFAEIVGRTYRNMAPNLGSVTPIKTISGPAPQLTLPAPPVRLGLSGPCIRPEYCELEVYVPSIIYLPGVETVIFLPGVEDPTKVLVTDIENGPRFTQPAPIHYYSGPRGIGALAPGHNVDMVSFVAGLAFLFLGFLPFGLTLLRITKQAKAVLRYFRVEEDDDDAYDENATEGIKIIHDDGLNPAFVNPAVPPEPHAPTFDEQRSEPSFDHNLSLRPSREDDGGSAGIKDGRKIKTGDEVAEDSSANVAGLALDSSPSDTSSTAAQATDVRDLRNQEVQTEDSQDRPQQPEHQPAEASAVPQSPSYPRAAVNSDVIDEGTPAKEALSHVDVPMDARIEGFQDIDRGVQTIDKFEKAIQVEADFLPSQYSAQNSVAGDTSGSHDESPPASHGRMAHEPVDWTPWGGWGVESYEFNGEFHPLDMEPKVPMPELEWVYSPYTTVNGFAKPSKGKIGAATAASTVPPAPPILSDALRQLLWAVWNTPWNEYSRLSTDDQLLPEDTSGLPSWGLVLDNVPTAQAGHNTGVVRFTALDSDGKTLCSEPPSSLHLYMLQSLTLSGAIFRNKLCSRLFQRMKGLVRLSLKSVPNSGEILELLSCQPLLPKMKVFEMADCEGHTPNDLLIFIESRRLMHFIMSEQFSLLREFNYVADGNGMRTQEKRMLAKLMESWEHTKRQQHMVDVYNDKLRLLIREALRSPSQAAQWLSTNNPS